MFSGVGCNVAHLSVLLLLRKRIHRPGLYSMAGFSPFFHNDIDELVESFTSAQREIAPEIELRLQIGLSRHCPISYLEDCLSYFWGNKNFYSIDLYGDEFAQPIENFKGIYRRAKSE